MPDHDLTERFATTRTRIASAATRAGRTPESVGLVAISKGQPATAIRALAELGQRDFGENYLQEALPKQENLRDLPLTWHFTGQIQANKTRPIAESFAWVHTLDRERTAMRLNDQRPPGLPPMNVCLQVRLEDEPGKGGLEPHEIPALAAKVSELPHLRLRGLMALPPPRDSFDEQKQLFDRLHSLLRELQASGFAVDTLSMGMSADLEAAIAAGATYVRIGTALFGERQRA
ncbi:YggS family pyridoxal phosphate-dependent enzyme [Povalibacter sp.]|uniref:YggS family pyridoxal phosphate-dependent enzyme n=1 Tax=Povalibacter sp. TaxID=1962978 RepID=UPI002F421B46